MTKEEVDLMNFSVYSSTIIHILNYINPEGNKTSSKDYEEFKNRYTHFMNDSCVFDCNDLSKFIASIDKQHINDLFETVFGEKQNFIKFDEDKPFVNRDLISDIVFDAIPAIIYCDKLTDTIKKRYAKKTRLDKQILDYLDLFYRMSVMRIGQILSSCFSMWLVRPYFEMMKNDYNKIYESYYLRRINKFYQAIEHYLINVVHPFKELTEANKVFVHALRVLFKKETDLENQTSGKLLVDAIETYRKYQTEHEDEYSKLCVSVFAKYNEFFKKD